MIFFTILECHWSVDWSFQIFMKTKGPPLAVIMKFVSSWEPVKPYLIIHSFPWQNCQASLCLPPLSHVLNAISWWRSLRKLSSTNSTVNNRLCLTLKLRLDPTQLLRLWVTASFWCNLPKLHSVSQMVFKCICSASTKSNIDFQIFALAAVIAGANWIPNINDLKKNECLLPAHEDSSSHCSPLNPTSGPDTSSISHSVSGSASSAANSS